MSCDYVVLTLFRDIPGMISLVEHITRGGETVRIGSVQARDFGDGRDAVGN